MKEYSIAAPWDFFFCFPESISCCSLRWTQICDLKPQTTKCCNDRHVQHTQLQRNGSIDV